MNESADMGSLLCSIGVALTLSISMIFLAGREKRSMGGHRLLLGKGANVSPRDSEGRTALSIAADNGNRYMVDVLLDSKKSTSPP